MGVAIGGTWWTSCGFRGCPAAASLRAWHPTDGGRLLDRQGAVISALAPVRRVNVPLSRIPPAVRTAFIAVEDRRFATHHGVDWHGVARASVANLRAGGVREGGSTITMQLARNVFLAERATERSVARKLLEVRYAGLLERALTKDEILERYLNAIYLGNGVYGVESASLDLFGKSVHDVTLAEAAMLVGLPKAPTTYSPRRSAERARARRDVVLNILAAAHVATPDAIASARRHPVTVPRTPWSPAQTMDSWAAEAVRNALDSLRAAGAIAAGVPDEALTVRTTFDRRAQRAAERVVAGTAAQIDRERSDAWRGASARTTSRQTQGAFVAIDPASGAIRALVGGRRIERGGFNRALRAQRQPGSAFKPFVYAAALGAGFTPATMVDDSPIAIGTGRAVWTPSNYGDEYAGPITLRDALMRSANAATVRISQTVGVARVVQQAHAQGIVSALPDVPSLALGAAAVTPLELTAAYAPFANGGLRVTPHMIDSVEDNFGRVLWRHPRASAKNPAATTPRVLPVVDAFLVRSLLQSVVDEGTGYAVRSAGIVGPVGGKTGTTNDGADLWFAGFTPSLVATIWFGADDPVSLGGNATAGRLAAPAWARFIRDGWHTPASDSAWTMPAGVERRDIEIASGTLAGGWCGPSRTEFFRAGTAPTDRCEGSYRLAMHDADDLADDMADDMADDIEEVGRHDRHRNDGRYDGRYDGSADGRGEARAGMRTAPRRAPGAARLDVHGPGLQQEIGEAVASMLQAIERGDDSRAITRRLADRVATGVRRSLARQAQQNRARDASIRAQQARER